MYCFECPKEKIWYGLEVTGLLGYFSKQAIFSLHEINSWKPEPKIFSHAALLMGIECHKCIAVDDAEIVSKRQLLLERRLIIT